MRRRGLRPPVGTAPAIVGGEAPPDDRGAERGNDRGSALISVTMIGLIAVLAVSSLAGRVVAEHRAVEDSLAQLRLYWAGMGHANYLLSRNRQVGPCGGTNTCSYGTGGMLTGGRNMLAEIVALQTWRYPEIATAYAFTATPTFSEVPGGRGRWQVGVAFARPAGAVEALRTAARVPSLEVRYCLVDSPGGSACSVVDGGGGSTAHFVTSVHRGPRPTN